MTNVSETISGAERAQYAFVRLLGFASHDRLFEPEDLDYSRNLLLDQFGFTEPYAGEVEETLLEGPQEPLDVLIDYGFETGLIPENTDTYRDLLDAKIMGQLLARPSAIIGEFDRLKAEQGIDAATDRFYQLNIDSNYIRMDRISKNVYWQQPSPYGDLEITINLSKPEKNPKEIAMARLLPPPVYPKCLLCRENVGYAGRINHPARQNLRILPLTLNGEKWRFQYSPYVYYNEHCIVFHNDHVPMKLTKDTLKRLLGFVESFPHYFIGSNADLPIVGGSILTHDHFQGGRHTFPIQKAGKEITFVHDGYPGVEIAIVNWPMSVLRLNAADPGVLLECGNAVYEAWMGYSDESADIAAFSEQDGERVRHNTVTPIVRRSADGGYEMDLVLRNNRTNEQHPEGIFHPHRELHHIKKENIGLIEVMGLAVLPGRLKDELDAIAGILAGEQAPSDAELGDSGHPLALHAPWIGELKARYGTALSRADAEAAVKNEAGLKFSVVLEHAGVYKVNEEGRAAFSRFVGHFGASRRD